MENHIKLHQRKQYLVGLKEPFPAPALTLMFLKHIKPVLPHPVTENKLVYQEQKF